MKKVLIIGNTDVYGGVGHIIKEYCQGLYHKGIKFDILYYDNISKVEQEYLDEIGAKYYKVPKYSKNPIKFVKYMIKFCSENLYDVVHCHASTAMLIMYAIPLHLFKRTPVVYQSHLDYAESYRLHYLFRPLVKKMSEVWIGVSQNACNWMFGGIGASKEYVILKNGVDYSHFVYNGEVRAQKRQILGIENRFVIGNVARFAEQKNHFFILQVFEQVYQMDKDAILVLVGEGELKNQVQALVAEKGLSNAVLFCTNTADIADYYNAMDVFLFPSKYEGLGIVAVEAQIAGLPVVASKNVPEEARISNDYFALDLSEDLNVWASKILELRGRVRQSITQDDFELTGYAIKSSIDKLEQIYNKF